MRLLYEERTGLKTEKNLFKLFLFFLCSSPLFAQIPINGFCKLDQFELRKQYREIHTLDYNSDSYTDLIFFNPVEKKILPVSGNAPDGFTINSEKNINYELSAIESYPVKNNQSSGFAFISRMSRTAGILSADRNGNIKFLYTYKLNSFPGNMAVTFLDEDDQPDVLISGSAFAGIKILSLVNRRFTEKTITTEGSYQFARFIDLNDDGFQDIAAYNNLFNSLHFFYNDGTGNCSEVRKIKLTEDAQYLTTFDLNSDGFSDIIVSSKNNIHILFGDFRASYDQRLDIRTNHNPDKFIVGDFNKDGNFDLAYIDRNSGVLSTIISKGGEEFHKEILQVKRNGFSDISSYYSRFISGLLYLTTEGEFGTVTNVSSLINDFSFSMGGDPQTIEQFDHNNNGIKDFAYIDNFESRLKLLIRDAAGIPSELYSINLFTGHKNLFIKNEGKENIYFYCYTEKENLLELIAVNFSKKNLNRWQIYIPGSIIDLKKDDSDREEGVFVLYSVNGNLYKRNYFLKNLKPAFKENKIADSFFTAAFIWGNQRDIAYWKVDNEDYSLYEIDLNGRRERKERVKNRIKNIVSFSVNETQFFYKIDLIDSEKNKFLWISTDSGIVKIDASDADELFRITKKNQLSFDPDKQPDTPVLYMYLPEEEAFYRLTFNKNLTGFNLKKLFTLKDAGDFFVSNLYSRNKHLIYIDKKLKLIKVKSLQ